MVLQILLVITIVLQLFAVGVAVKLTKVTKYNFSWMLLTIGFVLMVLQRLAEFLPYISNFQQEEVSEILSWFGVIISLSFAIGVFFIQKIFKYMSRVEDLRRHTEKMFLKAIIQTEEKERKRFAKDLHDGLGPILSTVKMSISTLENMNQDKVTKEIVENTNLAINEAIKSIKEISNNLSPHILDNFGLLRALRNFINKINVTQVIKINLASNIGDDRFDSDIEVVLYRVICELINNTIKHSKAKNIEISLFKEDKMLNIVYQDNGKGFDKSEWDYPNDRGMGLSNMISRINSLKGEMWIDTEPGKGMITTIKVRII
jgi:Signal transduction histidine kinase